MTRRPERGFSSAVKVDNITYKINVLIIIPAKNRIVENVIVHQNVGNKEWHFELMVYHGIISSK